MDEFHAKATHFAKRWLEHVHHDCEVSAPPMVAVPSARLGMTDYATRSLLMLLARPIRRALFEKRGDAFLRLVRFPGLHVVAEGAFDVFLDRG